MQKRQLAKHLIILCTTTLLSGLCPQLASVSVAKEEFSTLLPFKEQQPTIKTMIQAAKHKKFAWLATVLAELERGKKEKINQLSPQTDKPLTALHEAIEIGDTLLNQGATIEAKNKYKQTALYRAAYLGHIRIVQILLDLGRNCQVITQ